MEIIAALGTIIGLMALALKLLMNSWFKKSEELEAQKKKNYDATQTRLEKELDTLGRLFNEFKESAKIFSAKLDRSDKRIDELTALLNQTMKKVDEFQSSANGLIKNMIKTEFTELTKQVRLAKSGKT